MLRCYGKGCPIKEDCYRFTQPYPKRDAFGVSPYNQAIDSCQHFYSNLPEESAIRDAAYYIWLRNGKPENRAQEDWDEAYFSLCVSSGRIKT